MAGGGSIPAREKNHRPQRPSGRHPCLPLPVILASPSSVMLASPASVMLANASIQATLLPLFLPLTPRQIRNHCPGPSGQA